MLRYVKHRIYKLRWHIAMIKHIDYERPLESDPCAHLNVYHSEKGTLVFGLPLSILPGALSRSSSHGHCLPGAGPLTQWGGPRRGACDRYTTASLVGFLIAFLTAEASQSPARACQGRWLRGPGAILAAWRSCKAVMFFQRFRPGIPFRWWAWAKLIFFPTSNLKPKISNLPIRFSEEPKFRCQEWRMPEIATKLRYCMEKQRQNSCVSRRCRDLLFRASPCAANEVGCTASTSYVCLRPFWPKKAKDRKSLMNRENSKN